jgi:rubrerythrin
MNIKKTSLLGHFSANENKISVLYAAYSEKFPERSDFWKRLAKDEKRHSTLLSELDERFNNEILAWPISENAPAILSYIGQFLDDCIMQAQSESLKFSEAVNNALSVEQSMIEKKNFDIFPTANEEVKKVLEKLNRETEGHRLCLEKYVTDIGQIFD